MNNEEMLEAVRKDRPSQIIHKVLSFKLNEFGFYDVKVDMQSKFFETTIRHSYCILPYPMKSYGKLSEEDQADWRFKNV